MFFYTILISLLNLTIICAENRKNFQAMPISPIVGVWFCYNQIIFEQNRTPSPAPQLPPENIVIKVPPILTNTPPRDAIKPTPKRKSN